jgi:hypothetical protein
MLLFILWFYYLFEGMSVTKVAAIYSIVIFHDWLLWWNDTYYALHTGELVPTIAKFCKLIISIVCG